ncbi:MAG: hypothetical protein ACTSRO_03530 [Candidatus Heimdallarchaeaceae archaeon]
MKEEEIEQLPFSKIKNINFSKFSWIKVDRVRVEEGVELRVFRIPCKDSKSKINVITIAGLSSHFLGWSYTEYVLSKIANVYHIETREKSSAKYFKRDVIFSMEKYAEDVEKIVEHYNLEKTGFHLLGDSFGSEIAIKYVERGVTPPKSLILISPTETFAFSSWMKKLFSLAPYWLYYPLLPILLFILKYFRTDIKKDIGTYYVNRRNRKSVH